MLADVLLTLTSTAPQAADLGFLLHKHPDRVQRFDVSGGVAHVFYPEVEPERCTVALLLEVDPVGLVRGTGPGGRGGGFALAQYVNDRPYAASSLLAVALRSVFRSAMARRCDARPDLVGTPLPLTVRLPAVPCPVEGDLVRAFFEPLGWRVHAERPPLDPLLPSWGPAPVVDLTLEGEQTVADALSHLYVLLPVLDGSKHYWVGADEIDKLLAAAGSWLPDHPERERITHRYLAGQRGLTQTALDRLAEVDDTAPAPTDDAEGASEVEPAAVPLARTRAAAVLAELRAVGARSVADLGCGEGALIDRLLDEPSVTRVLGTDVSVRALERAARRVERRAERQRERLTLVQSSLTYTDDRLVGFDAAVLMEVVEHLDPPRLGALERAVLGHARPGTLVVTTPNAEHNVRYGLHDGEHRHTDHRFEWDRTQFRSWAQAAAERHGYTVRFAPVGPEDPDVGPPTQLAVLTRGEAA